MCNNRRDNMERSNDLNHIKILAKMTSNLRNESIGIYKDKGYSFEPISKRTYIMRTVNVNGIWTWE